MLWVSPNPGGRCRPSLRHWFANGAFVPSVCDEAPVRGRCGGIPRRRGCAGDFSAGQGEGLPPSSLSCCPSHFLWFRARDRMTGASSPLLLGAAHVCDAAAVVAGKSACATTGQTPCMSDIQTLYTAEVYERHRGRYDHPRSTSTCNCDLSSRGGRSLPPR